MAGLRSLRFSGRGTGLQASGASRNTGVERLRSTEGDVFRGVLWAQRVACAWTQEWLLVVGAPAFSGPHRCSCARSWETESDAGVFEEAGRRTHRVSLRLSRSSPARRRPRLRQQVAAVRLSVRVVLMTCHSLNAKCPLVRARLRQRRRDEEKETQASGVSSHGLGGRCERTSRGAEEASGSAGDLAFPLAVCPPGCACLGPRTWGPLRRSALGTACGEGSDSRASEEVGVVKASVKASSKQVQLPGVAFRLH